MRVGPITDHGRGRAFDLPLGGRQRINSVKRRPKSYHNVMTRLSPPTLYHCPACAAYFVRSALTFLHFYHDVPEWSDGKNEQWWVGLSAPVGRCPTCLAVIWLDDANALMPVPQEPRQISSLSRLWHLLTGDRSGRLRDDREWASLPRVIKEAKRLVELSTTQDYIDALVQIAHVRPDREEYLRRKLWWASNDYLRRESSTATLEVNAARANMERLLDLLPSTTRTLERVEIYRQLGRFQEALDLIPSIPSDQCVKANLQKRWAEVGDSTMRIIPVQSTAHARGTVVW